MSGAVLLSLFFVVMAAVSLAGYFLVLRPESKAAQGTSLVVAEEQSAREVLTETLHTLGESLPSRGGGTDGSIRRSLIAAGYRAPEAPAIFNGISFALALFFAVIIGTLSLGVSDVPSSLLAAMAGGGLGYLLPKQILGRMIRARSTRLASALPSALDLLVLSVEAGQALDMAILETSREIRRPFPDLADELVAMNLGLRASTSREQVFRDFGERSLEPELRKLASLLVDTDRFGTSLAPALRTHARYLRVRRRQTAQEAARKVSVKLVFPIFFLVFPAVLLVTLGPAVLQMMGALKNLFQN